MKKAAITTLILIAAAMGLGSLLKPGLTSGTSICASHPVPTNLVATYNLPPDPANENKPFVFLHWLSNDPNPVGYDVERSEDGGVTYTRLAFGYPAGHTWYSSGFHGATILSGWTYYFRVRVSDDNRGTCEGPYSNIATVTIP